MMVMTNMMIPMIDEAQTLNVVSINMITSKTVISIILTPSRVCLGKTQREGISEARPMPNNLVIY